MFGYTLSRFTGSDHALFYTSVNSRDVTDSGGSVGMFVHSVPVLMRCDAASAAGFVTSSHGAIVG